MEDREYDNDKIRLEWIIWWIFETLYNIYHKKSSIFHIDHYDTDEAYIKRLKKFKSECIANQDDLRWYIKQFPQLSWLDVCLLSNKDMRYPSSFSEQYVMIRLVDQLQIDIVSPTDTTSHHIVLDWNNEKHISLEKDIYYLISFQEKYRDKAVKSESATIKILKVIYKILWL